ncbi:MurR/RpiR family transcriptional regulator [Pullulanibacillus sp. KACC 23026]|uniref:MurR/RpiR family transcriptional regulator n=1 Tax=Pullulanibacillus sp. KACC 23026 TaxID=3028315 RepID=UPI0023AF9B8F|nr:MurR/RpiR family transcriptional regulator [Pullulanibacillus sp. KACC 23026]WEG11947.1 MurR/RpiR family transcriptional regulator [Pullulanibacillus sp. KACC 23026]
MEQVNYCLANIRSNYQSFNKTEKLIADYILESPNKILYQTISQVADDLKIANSTVFRFCKTLGFKGYQAMKITLAAEVANPYLESVQEKITEYDTERQITEKIFNTTIQTFKETMKMIDFNQVKQAVDTIVKADRVEFYGLGNSAIVALDAHHKFIGSGITTAAYTDSYLQQKAATQLTNKDVAVILSDLDHQEDLFKVFEIAKASGAKTIGFIHFSNSPLSRGVDVALNMAVNGMNDQLENGVSSRILQLSLIDALYVNVINAREGFLKNSIKKLKSYLGRP